MQKIPNDDEEAELIRWHELEHFVMHRDLAGLVSTGIYHLIRKVETTGKGLDPSPDDKLPK